MHSPWAVTSVLISVLVLSFSAHLLLRKTIPSRWASLKQLKLSKTVMWEDKYDVEEQNLEDVHNSWARTLRWLLTAQKRNKAKQSLAPGFPGRATG